MIARTQGVAVLKSVLLAGAIACGSACSSSDDDPNSDDSDVDGSGGDGDGEGTGSITVNGVTYEVDRVLDCSIGNEGAPDDRQFVGKSADGTIELSVAYWGDDNEFGLNGVTLETEVEGNTWTWASSYAGTDGTFEVTVTESGAEGNATVGVLGINAPAEEFEATWSFECMDSR